MDEKPKTSLRSAVLKGAAWSLALRWGMRLLGLLSTVLLARLLSPSDFGLVAMAMLVVAFVQAWLAFGVNTALIQNQDATREHYDTAWTIRILQGVVVAVGVAAAAPFAATYFEEPRITAVLLVLSLAILLRASANIGVVAFRKDLEFDKEFRFQIIGKILGFVVTLAAAVWLRNYWALVIGIIAGYCVACGLSYVMHPYRPRFSLSRVRELWSFSQWMLVGSIGHFLETKADEILVAGLGSTRQMGLYSVAAEMGSMPGSELAAPLNQALVPGFAKLQREPDRLATAYLNVLGTVSAVTFPAGIGLAMVADEIVATLLGAQWTDAGPLLSVLAVFGGIRASNSLAGSLFLGSGRPGAAAAMGWINATLLLAIAFPLVTPFGAQGIAVAKLGAGAILALVILTIVTRITTVTARQIVACLWRTVLAAGCMAGAVAAIPVSGGGVVVDLVIKVIAGIASYSAVLLILWRLVGCPDGAEQFFLTHVRRRFAR